MATHVGQIVLLSRIVASGEWKWISIPKASRSNTTRTQRSKATNDVTDILVEACVGSLAESLAAERGGADRLELCDDLSSAGSLRASNCSAL